MKQKSILCLAIAFLVLCGWGFKKQNAKKASSFDYLSLIKPEDSFSFERTDTRNANFVKIVTHKGWGINNLCCYQRS